MDERNDLQNNDSKVIDVPNTEAVEEQMMAEPPVPAAPYEPPIAAHAQTSDQPEQDAGYNQQGSCNTKNNYQQPPQKPNNDKAVAALVLGILACCFSFTFVGFILGIIGLVVSVGANKISKTGMGTAGFILSIIGLVIGIISTVSCMFFGCVGMFL